MTAPDELAEAERYLRESAAISSWHVVAGVHSEALALVLAEYDRRGTELARLGAVCADMNRIRNEAAAASAALAGTTTPPPGDWSRSWRELTGYVQQAAKDGTDINPADLDSYMADLKRRALEPVRYWMATVLASTPTTEEATPDA